MPGNGLTIASSRPCPPAHYRTLSGAPLGLFPAPPILHAFSPHPTLLSQAAPGQLPDSSHFPRQQGRLSGFCLSCCETRRVALSGVKDSEPSPWGVAHLRPPRWCISLRVLSARLCRPWAAPWPAGALWETRAWRRRVLETASCIPFVLYKRTLRHPAPWSGVFQRHLEVTEAWIEKKECFKITCPLDVLLKLRSLRSTSHTYRTPKWMNEKWKVNS